jgi:hypothetical protein
MNKLILVTHPSTALYQVDERLKLVGAGFQIQAPTN